MPFPQSDNPQVAAAFYSYADPRFYSRATPILRGIPKGYPRISFPKYYIPHLLKEKLEAYKNIKPDSNLWPEWEQFLNSFCNNSNIEITEETIKDILTEYSWKNLPINSSLPGIDISIEDPYPFQYKKGDPLIIQSNQQISVGSVVVIRPPKDDPFPFWLGLVVELVGSFNFKVRWYRNKSGFVFGEKNCKYSLDSRVEQILQKKETVIQTVKFTQSGTIYYNHLKAILSNIIV